MAYEIYRHGQITKFEAGTIYRAMKENKINVLPETTKTLYNQCDLRLQFATERYNQDSRFYDAIYTAVEAILEGNLELAQEKLTAWEAKQIKLAGKKSMFHKYQKSEEE